MAYQKKVRRWKCKTCGRILEEITYCVACAVDARRHKEDSIELAKQLRERWRQEAQQGLQEALQRQATETTQQQSNAATGDVRGLGVDVSPPGVGEACAGT